MHCFPLILWQEKVDMWICAYVGDKLPTPLSWTASSDGSSCSSLQPTVQQHMCKSLKLAFFLTTTGGDTCGCKKTSSLSDVYRKTALTLDLFKHFPNDFKGSVAHFKSYWKKVNFVTSGHFKCQKRDLSWIRLCAVVRLCSEIHPSFATSSCKISRWRQRLKDS